MLATPQNTIPITTVVLLNVGSLLALLAFSETIIMAYILGVISLTFKNNLCDSCVLRNFRVFYLYRAVPETCFWTLFYSVLFFL